MAETVNVREIVLNMLLEVTRDGKASSQVLTDWLTKYQYLSKQERGFISRLMRTTLENMIFIDTVLNHYSSVKVGKMKRYITQEAMHSHSLLLVSRQRKTLNMGSI